VDAKDLFHVLHTDAGVNVLVDLRVDGDHFLAMPREIQRDHLQGRFIHVDFLRIARDEKIDVEVPVHLIGESHGVKEGGVVEHHLWNDISGLGINESLKVSDLIAPPNCTILTSPNEVVVSVVPPQVLRVEEAVPEELAEAEGEAAAGEEGAEGEGGPEGSGESES
jgi:large subunit ribosomal protein L25